MFCFVQQEETVFVFVAGAIFHWWTIDSSGLSFISTTSIGKRYIAEIFRNIFHFIPSSLNPECVFWWGVLLMGEEGRRKGGKKWYQLIYTCINISHLVIPFMLGSRFFFRRGWGWGGLIFNNYTMFKDTGLKCFSDYRCRIFLVTRISQDNVRRYFRSSPEGN